MRRRLVLLLGLGVGLSVATLVAARALDERRFRAEVSAARQSFAAGRFRKAEAQLARASKRWPGRAEVEFYLGACEKVLGRTEAALAAWERVPDQAPEAALAALSRGRLALDLRRYGLAESVLDRAVRFEGETAFEARRQRARLHWQLGRLDEYRQFLRGEARRAVDPSPHLRLLWYTDSVAYPIDGMRQEIARARKDYPGDDRVWLAAADLATRSGQFEEADGWLDRCERARPSDPAVWDARLRWARAADRPDEVERAVAHLSAAATPRLRAADLRAWLAARSGDRAAERSALEEVLALDPGHSAALDRLAEVAAADGQSGGVAELRRKKAEIDAAYDRYKTLMAEADLPAHAPELAREAEALGRWFEAERWRAVAARRDPSSPAADRDRARAEADRKMFVRAEAPSGAGAQTLADLLAPLRPPGGWKVAAGGSQGVPQFRDEAEASGLVFRFQNGASELRQLPETMSGGVGVVDFDGDGRLDVYAVQGGEFPPAAGPAAFSDRLFRNLGGGRFEDATAASGLGSLPGGYGLGVAVGDYDNDGRPDLFVTRWRSYALYHNLGGGRFEDATRGAGLDGGRDWPSSAAWADLDGDGDLDLYVCHYLKWDEANVPLCQDQASPGHTYCSPRSFPAMPDHVFRNDGGRFTDVTQEAGIVDPDGRGLGVVAADFDGDGKTDLFVANDMTANLFFRNQGGFRFVEDGHGAGLASNATGGYLAGMGVACGDFDGDGRPDLAVTNFFGESTTVYHNLGGGLFSDWTAAAGMAAPTRFVLGFGLAALDANNDGRLDLAQANGHVNDYHPTTPYAMPAQLFLGDGSGRFADVSAGAGAPWQVARVGRGLAVGDLDNDGRVDVLIVSDNAPLAFLRNNSGSPGHFLTLALEGSASNRDAVGARVTVTASGRSQSALRFGGGSYLSASDPRLHFGLGQARAADRVEVAWPSGRRDRYEGLAADTGYRLREGDPTPGPLAGFSTPPPPPRP